MRYLKLQLLGAATAVLLNSVVHAEDAPKSATASAAVLASAPAAKGVYEGLDANGKVVRLTITDVGVDTFQRVAPSPAKHYPQLHWSARFGTGTAAAAQR
jgi:hypothetical protein